MSLPDISNMPKDFTMCDKLAAKHLAFTLSQMQYITAALSDTAEAIRLADLTKEYMHLALSTFYIFADYLSSLDSCLGELEDCVIASNNLSFSYPPGWEHEPPQEKEN